MYEPLGRGVLRKFRKTWEGKEKGSALMGHPFSEGHAKLKPNQPDRAVMHCSLVIVLEVVLGVSCIKAHDYGPLILPAGWI